MSDAANAVTEAVAFTVTRRIAGYAHEKIEGTYTGTATVEMVKEKFYDPYFGGRDAWIDPATKRFGCIVHTD
jgi:hypothetical protein